MSFSVAMLSIHTSPLDTPGRTKDAGGMNVYIRELARELGQHHNTVDIFTRWTDAAQTPIVQLSPHVRVIHIQAGPIAPVHKNELYELVPNFVEGIEAFRHGAGVNYDVLHSHYWLSGLVAMQLAARWDVPHITMFHTLGHLKQLANPDAPEPAIRLETERRLIQHADHIIAATNDERTQMMRHCGVTGHQVRVIPCGVDLKLFVPHDKTKARKVLGLKPHQPVLLFAGRLDPFKGPDVLLRAVALMKEEAQIVIVGGKLTGDPELQQLRMLATELKISRRVHFLGARDQQELPMIYSAADVTAVPSYHESFGLVAVESLACGTPVVATRAGGLTTVIRDGVTGYLVPRCPGFFAGRLDALLQNSELLAQMHATARLSVLQFSWKGIASQVSEVYHDAISETRQLVAR